MSERITFRGAAPGDEQIADAYHSAGNMADWAIAVKPLASYPRALVALYGSFTAPMLMILEAKNFVIDLANRTSTGKTTTLRAAASVWGDPDEQSRAPALWTWDATPVFIERLCAVVCDKPVILDDTKRARDPKKIAGTIYGVCSGQSRGRGTVAGIGLTRPWRTVLITSGEAPITSFTEDGGTRARVLEIRGSPFGIETEQTRRLVSELNMGVMANYGHAGPAFVQWLVNNRDRWPEFRSLYRRAIESYAARAPTPEGGRLAQYAAALTTAAHLAHEALALPWDHRAPLTSLWAEMAAEAGEASGEVRALRDVLSWAHSNKETFHRLGHTQLAPARGWSGRWDRECGLAFYPHLLKKVLVDFGFSPAGIIGGWKQRDWLDCEKAENTKAVRMDADRARCIVIRHEAIQEIEGAVGGDDTENP